MKSLADPTAPFTEVQMSLQELTESAETCKKHASDVQNSMANFKYMAQELFTACKNESAEVQTQHAKVVGKHELAEQEKKERTAQEVSAQAHLKKMGDQMDSAQKTFKDTLDKMPTG